MNVPSKPRDEAERRQMDVASKALSRAVPILLSLAYERDEALTRARAITLLQELGILNVVESKRDTRSTDRNSF